METRVKIEKYLYFQYSAEFSNLEKKYKQMAMERNIAIFTLQLFRIAKGDRKCSAQRTNPACRYRSIKVRQRMSRNYVALAQDPEVGLAGSHKDEVINL